MFFLKFFKSAFVWQVPSIVVRDVPHHHGGFSSAKRPGNRKRCMSGCGWGAVDLWELRHASYSPFDVHRFTLTLKGTHISHVKKKHDTSSPKVATFCKRLDFCFQEWYSTLSRGKCYINPLHTVWDSHPPPPKQQHQCSVSVYLGVFFLWFSGKRIRVSLGCSHPSKPPKPAWHRFLLLEVAHPLGHPGGTS